SVVSSYQSPYCYALLTTDYGLLHKGHAIDFVQRRDAREHFRNRRFAKRRQPFRASRAPHFRSWAALEYDFADMIRYVQQFVYRSPAAISRRVAHFTPDRLVEHFVSVLVRIQTRLAQILIRRLMSFLAMSAQDPNKPLGQDAVQG